MESENDTEKKRDAIARFKRGDRWFVGVDSATGKLANFRWVTTAWELIPELERNIVPGPGQAFVYALCTGPRIPAAWSGFLHASIYV